MLMTFVKISTLFNAVPQECLWVISFVTLCVAGGMLAFAATVAGLMVTNSRSPDNSYKMKLELCKMGLLRYGAGTSSITPLRGKIAIVTGSTAGLGQQVAADLFELGCTVIVASRTVRRCNETITRIKEEYAARHGTGRDKMCGKLEAMQLDTSDLDNVRAFVKAFHKTHSSLHLLINNAGIHYMSSPGQPMFHPSIKCNSKQGYDLAFATNYMGHWLLTQLLLPTLTASGSPEQPTRVVNTSSAYHLSVDGEMLRPTGPVPAAAAGSKGGRAKRGAASDAVAEVSPVVFEVAPMAARTDINTIRHRRRSYGNNKLAQILFTNELDRRLKAEGNFNTQVVSVCPGWVSGTNVAPPGVIGGFIHFCGCRLTAGSFASIGACLHPFLTGGEHVTNYTPFWTNTVSFAWLTRLNIRDTMSDLLGLLLLLTQSFSYGCHVVRSSPESYNEQLARELYEWTEAAVLASSE